MADGDVRASGARVGAIAKDAGLNDGLVDGDVRASGARVRAIAKDAGLNDGIGELDGLLDTDVGAIGTHRQMRLQPLIGAAPQSNKESANGFRGPRVTCALAGQYNGADGGNCDCPRNET